MNGPLVLAAGRLRIEFQRQADRYAHRIGLLHDDALAPLLDSCEGTEHDLWPASPPFQELRVERQAGGRMAALLVGMAGASHWSASVEIDPVQDVVWFDVACRLRAADPDLGSQYRLAAGCTATTTGDSVELACRAGRAWLSLLALGPDHPAQLASHREQIRVIAAAPGNLARTVRWKYAISARPA